MPQGRWVRWVVGAGVGLGLLLSAVALSARWPDAQPRDGVQARPATPGWGAQQGSASGAGPAGTSPTTRGHPAASPAGTEHPADARPPLGRALVVADPSGDVVDDAGAPPPDPQPAADLRQVAVTRDGGLHVAFTLAAPPPVASSEGMVWSLELWAPELRYSISAQLLGTTWYAGVLHWSTGAQENVPDAWRVEGSRLSVRVGGEHLPELPVEYRWVARTQVFGAYEDTAESPSAGS